MIIYSCQQSAIFQECAGLFNGDSINIYIEFVYKSHEINQFPRLTEERFQVSSSVSQYTSDIVTSNMQIHSESNP